DVAVSLVVAVRSLALGGQQQQWRAGKIGTRSTGQALLNSQRGPTGQSRVAPDVDVVQAGDADGLAGRTIEVALLEVIQAGAQRALGGAQAHADRAAGAGRGDVQRCMAHAPALPAD